MEPPQAPSGAAGDGRRDLRALPKAHLHLHLTGGMRPTTLVELAARHGVRLPEELLDPAGARVDVSVRRGWSRFQRLYDAARDVVRTPRDVRRLVHEIAEDEREAGSGWVEVQVDPSSYAARMGGLPATVELVLSAMADATAATGVGMALVVAANRTRHPFEAETLARLAKRYAGQGVVGFGLSNDETRGPPEEFAKAFRIARDAALLSVPHAGETRSDRSVRGAVHALGAHRIGHGVRAVEDAPTVELLAERGVVLEVCPASNVALGVAGAVEEVPVRALREAGVAVALGADDPLLFRSGLLEQYEAVRVSAALSDADLADLARCAVRG
ncbi:MAG TPA: adenosine deaminase, partial [Mycobacteriales bacterium]|nr:adenosine deaminase [Mycobacteriales bacterium]